MPDDTSQPEQQPDVPTNATPPQVPVNPYFTPQPVEPTPVTPVAPMPPIDTPSETKPQKAPRKKVFLFGGAGIVALAVIGGLAWFLFGQGGESALAKSFRENSAYVYRPIQENVAVSKEFSFDTSLKAEDGGDYFNGDEVKKYMNVYSDPSLTKVARADIMGRSGKNITFKAPAFSDADDEVSGESVRISNDREWGLYDMYYIAQFVDLKTGEKLEKPIVTPFSTRKEIPTPVVQVNVTANGDARFSWSPIEGATAYYIVALDKNDYNGSAKIIGQVDGASTEWVSDDKEVLVKKIVQQNAIFQDGYTNDQLLDPELAQRAQENALSGEGVIANYGVIAAVEDRYSALSPLDVDLMKSQLPHEIAVNAAKKLELKLDKSTVDTFGDIPTRLPVTMADNTTVMKSVIIDTSKVRKYDGFILVGGGRLMTIEVPFTIEGTNLSDNYHVEIFNDATYVDEVAKIAERNLAERGKTGQVEPKILSETPNIGSIKASTTKPSVPYKINASNPMTEFIAANMLNGEKYIDVSTFVTPNNPVSAVDAFEEATSQNPYILLHVSGSYTYVQDKHVFIIDYDQSRDEILAEQKKIDEEVKRVVGSIIKPGMSERDKVQAINDYITERTTYSVDAYNAGSLGIAKFRNSWTPSGVLFDKTAVCGGYAEAFKVLADAAGLESVYVTGLANSGPHAWNKVKVDGKWRMIDTTWNEGGNDYFLLTDKEVSAKRTNVEDKRWMADALVTRYAAN